MKGESRQIFKYISGKEASAVPKLPTDINLSEWEDKRVPLKGLLRIGSQGHEDDQKNCDAGHLISSRGSSTSPRLLLEKEVFLCTGFVKITMTSLGKELNPRQRRRTSEEQRGEGNKVITNFITML